ncbi:MAG: B12-binding domain-containing radical SAM protein, partial [Acidobacteriota bacterium]
AGRREQNRSRLRSALEGTSFSLHDFHLTDFQQAKAQGAQQWSWASKVDDAVAELHGVSPAVLGFSCYLWNTDHSIHLAQVLKRLLPECVMVFGGPDAGPRADALLRCDAVDVVVEGDGELPFAALLEAVAADGDLSLVPAVRYLREGELISNPPAETPIDLAEVAGVYRDVPEGIGTWAWPHLLYETLRGCPYRCSYCMYGKTPLNAKPVELAVDELATLLARGEVVEIIDPTFTTYKNRAKDILRRLGDRDYEGRIYLEAYADSIDDEMAELMAAARVCMVGIGFQTLSAEGLKAVRRPRNLERFERAVARLHAHRIGFYVDVIYGLPGTAVDDFLSTIDYLYRVGGDVVDFGLVIYRLLGLPGSPMMDDVEEHGLVFNPNPPYELLQSHTFSLQDVIFCERFRHAFTDFTALFNRERVRELSADTDLGVSGLVRRFMEAGQCSEAFLKSLSDRRREPAA